MSNGYSNGKSAAICKRALARISCGEVQAIGDIYDAMSRQIMALALSILHDRGYAEDAMQDTFVKIIEKIDTYRDDGNARAWIMQIARNTAIDIGRKRCRDICLDEDMGGYEFSNDVAERLSVEDALRRLPLTDREIVVMHTMSGLRHREIGDILGMSEDAVQKRYRRAISALRKYLE